MTAVAVRSTRTRPPTPRSALRQAMAAEWIKLISVRSHRVTLAAYALLSVGVSIAVGISDGAHRTHPGYDPTNQALAGLGFGELLIGVLGVLVITGEYSSGSIRSTLAAVPRRPRLLAAKAAVFAMVALVSGELVTWASYFAGQAASGSAPHATLGEPGVARAVLLTGAYLPLIGLFGLAIGTMVRNSAGAIAVFVALLLVLPVVLASLGSSLQWYAPESILASSVASTVGPRHVSPGVGYGLMALYTALSLGAGLTVLVRRDA